MTYFVDIRPSYGLEVDYRLVWKSEKNKTMPCRSLFHDIQYMHCASYERLKKSLDLRLICLSLLLLAELLIEFLIPMSKLGWNVPLHYSLMLNMEDWFSHFIKKLCLASFR